jgi:hypothetical protein
VLNKSEDEIKTEQFIGNPFDALPKYVFLLTAVVTGFLWYRFIMSLQIFKGSSYMIFLLKRSIVALLPFTALTIMTIYAFSEIMYQLQLETINSTSELFAEELGDDIFVTTSTDSLQKMLFTTFGAWGDETENFSPYAWLLFFGVLVLNNVILFNFVVAQASDEYATFVEKKEQSFFYLKA